MKFITFVVSLAPLLLASMIGSISAWALEYGNQAVGTESAPQSVTVTNPNSSLAIQFTLSISSADFVRKGGTCSVNVPMSLGANKSCVLQVVFAPKSVGSKSGFVYYQAIAGSRHSIADLHGTGVSVAPCVYSLAPSSATVPPAGATGSVTLTTGSTCAWTITTSGPITPLSARFGRGSATISYSVPPNLSESTRTMQLVVAGKTLTVTQPPVCQFTLSPTSQSFAASAGKGDIRVTASAGICPWSATAPLPVTIVSGTRGIGNGTVSYSISANTSSASRSVAMVVAGLPFTVTQAGVCTYELTPLTQSVPATGGQGVVTVSAASGCSWTASAPPEITILSGRSGAGTGSVSFSLSPNPAGTPRSFTLQVADRTATITQPAQTPATISFAARVAYSAPSPGVITTGDFNNDSFVDLIVLSTVNSFSYMQGNPNGTFNPAITHSMAALTGAGAGDLVAADFNGDRNLDLAVVHGSSTGAANGFGNQVTIHLGDGHGGFLSPGFQFVTGGSDVTVAAADFDEDGRLDLAIGSLDVGAVCLHRGLGDGTFGPAVLIDTGAAFVPAGYRANGVASADVNRDGHADLVTANASTNTLSVLLGNGRGGFGTPTLFSVGTFPGSLAVTDLNGDQVPDIVSANTSGSFSVLIGSGGGAFAPARTILVDTGVGKVLSGDFDKDGKMDLAVVGNEVLTIYKGDGQSELSQSLRLNVPGSTPSGVVRDFNLDALPDIAFAQNSTSLVNIHLNRTGLP